MHLVLCPVRTLVRVYVHIVNIKVQYDNAEATPVPIILLYIDIHKVNEPKSHGTDYVLWRLGDTSYVVFL